MGAAHSTLDTKEHKAWSKIKEAFSKFDIDGVGSIRARDLGNNYHFSINNFFRGISALITW